MSSSSQAKKLLFLIVVLGLGLAGGTYFLQQKKSGSEETPALVPFPGEVTRNAGPASTPLTADPVHLTEEREGGREDPDRETTVIHPLKIELELLRAAKALQAEGQSALGSGKSARISGRITKANNVGVQASVEFLEGANQGRILLSDANGEFGASDLYPGLSIVSVTGPGIVGSKREISLRQRRETLFNINYARPASMQGKVLNERGEPMVGARVEMDGQVTSTGVEGRFYFPQMTAGAVLVLVEQAGYATLREVFKVTGGFAIGPDQIEFRMKRGASLELVVAENLGVKGEAQLFFLPTQAGAGMLRDFPWYTVNPTPVYPGGRVLIDDLPEGRLQIWLFHAGAVANPPVIAANLLAGQRTTKTLHLQPSPLVRGEVTLDGEPVSGARVTLEAPDRVEAALAQFGQGVGYLETAVLPFLPSIAQSVMSTAGGRFELGAYEHKHSTRYLVADFVNENGAYRGAVVVEHGTRDAKIALEPTTSGESTLQLALSDRYQGLPIEVRMDATPRGKWVLSPRESLEINNMEDGQWRLSVHWSGQRLLGPREFDLRGLQVFSVDLPEGAIDGQTADERERAGL